MIRETFTYKLPAGSPQEVYRQALDKAAIEKRHPESATIDRLSATITSAPGRRYKGYKFIVVSDSDEH